MRSERRRPNCLVFEDGRCRSSAYPAAVSFTPSRPSASAWSRAGWRWALSTVGWTEFSSAAPADHPTDTARRQPENCDTPENGAERKQQPSRGRRPGVVSREWTGFRNEMRQEDSPLGRSAFRVADDTVVVRQIGVKPWRIFPPRTEVLPRLGLRPATLRGCSSRSPMTLTRLFSSMEIRLMRR